MVDVKELGAQMVRKGYNQRTLSARVKSSEATISRIFRTRTCGTRVAEKIIEALEIENPGPIFFAPKDTQQVSEQLRGD
jgi:uncharacterized protein YerC